MNNNEIIYYLNNIGINDKDYIQNCIIANNEIINKNLSEQFNKIHHHLFCSGDEFLQLWINNLYEFFGCNVHPYTTNLLLISGIQYHEKNMNKACFDEKQKQIHFFRLKDALTKDIYIKNYDGIRYSQMIWGTYFIHAKIIECGCLQFERCSINGIGNYIDMHIPADVEFTIENIKKSIHDSKDLINKYFGYKDVEYMCSSWMLSPQIIRLLDNRSNIKQFSDLFDIQEGDSCHEDILNFVFHSKETSYENLKETTSLQRKIKKEFMNGNKFKLGIGKLKKI